MAVGVYTLLYEYVMYRYGMCKYIHMYQATKTAKTKRKICWHLKE